MSAFLWTMVVLLILNCVVNAYRIGTGTQSPPLSAGERAVVLLIDGALLAWGLSALEVL